MRISEIRAQYLVPGTVLINDSGDEVDGLWIRYWRLKFDLHLAKYFSEKPKEDTSLDENDVTSQVTLFSSNEMSSFGFPDKFFSKWKSTFMHSIFLYSGIEVGKTNEYG